MTSLASRLRDARQSGDALQPLTLLGWRGGLVAIFVGLLLTYPVFSYPVPYWRHGDMDLTSIYNAFLLNDGKPQEYFDHPAYFNIVATALWLKLLHAIGLIQAYSLSTMPPASDGAAFAAAMTGAVRAGRALTMLLALAMVAGFAFLIRRIISDWRIALMAVFALALSGGVALHLDRLRSELLSAMPVIFAVILLIEAARRATPTRPMWLAMAALFCGLGMESKVQAILLIAGLPVMLMPFGSAATASVAPWQSFRASLVPIAALAVATAIAAWAASPIIAAGLDPELIRKIYMQPFHGLPYGAIGLAIMTWVVIGMLVFAYVWRVSPAETLASLLAVALGAFVSLLALKLVWHPANAAAVINPIERMMSYAIPYDTDANLQKLGSSLLADIGLVLARLSYVFHTSFRPAVFLMWLVIPGVIYAWIKGERALALQTGALMAVVFGIDLLGARRGLKPEYWIFTDPLIIIAGAMLLEKFPHVRRARYAMAIALALFVAHIAVSQASRVRVVISRSGPDPICTWNNFYMPQMKLPFCPS